MFDANGNPKGRYERLRRSCLGLFPDMPEELPKTGLVLENGDQKRFGVWIMPDNIATGELETFLRYLVPDLSEPIWKYAAECVTTARDLGAECRETHIPKARLYTWLAWQDPPGYSPGIALTKKILDPHSPHASIFVAWFRDLYQL